MTQYPDDIIAEMTQAILTEIQNKPPEAVILGGRREGKTYGMAEMYARACWSVVEKRMGWRPIEELPEDGTLWQGYCDGHSRATGEYQLIHWDDVVGVCNEETGDAVPATHFAPLLPPPPSSAEADT